MKKRMVRMTVLDLDSGAKYILLPLVEQGGADQKVDKSNGKDRDRQRQDRNP